MNTNSYYALSVYIVGEEEPVLRKRVMGEASVTSACNQMRDMGVIVNDDTNGTIDWYAPNQIRRISAQNEERNKELTNDAQPTEPSAGPAPNNG